MKLFRSKGKHDDPDSEKELVLDTGADGDSSPEAQSPPEPGPAPAASEEAATEIPADQVEQPASQDNFLAEISAQASKEMAEQEQPADGAPSQDDDALDPGLLDIFKDARTEVEEGCLAADLENIPAQEILEEMRAVSHGLGIPPNGLGRSHDDKAGQLTADAAQQQTEDGGPDTEAGEPKAEADVVQPDEGPGSRVAEERSPLTQAH
jgi:hypothetical protein